MGGYIFFLLCLNSIFFSLIFWILTWVFKYFYFNKQKKRKLEFYECGFPSTIQLKVQVSLAYCLIILFFLLYDLEFIGFFFFSFFYTYVSSVTWVIFFTFYFLLLICFLIDYYFNLLDFIVNL